MFPCPNGLNFFKAREQLVSLFLDINMAFSKSVIVKVIVGMIYLTKQPILLDVCLDDVRQSWWWEMVLQGFTGDLFVVFDPHNLVSYGE